MIHPQGQRMKSVRASAELEECDERNIMEIDNTPNTDNVKRIDLFLMRTATPVRMAVLKALLFIRFCAFEVIGS